MNRKHGLKKNYGLTVKQYHQMLLAQGGCCAVCEVGFYEVKRHLAVDHCHTTNKVRGLLCTNCNTGIGKMRDRPSLLRKAADYLIASQSGLYLLALLPL